MCRFTRYTYLSGIAEMMYTIGGKYVAEWTTVSEELKLTVEEKTFLMSRLLGNRWVEGDVDAQRIGMDTGPVPSIFADLPLDAGYITGLAMLGIDFYEAMKDAPRNHDAILPSPATASQQMEEVD